MADRHTEVELKFRAEGVSLEEFREFVFATGIPVCAHRSTSSEDVYWAQADSVVRHRHLGGGGELTVKRRRSAEDVVERLEVDLRFSESTSVADVEAFLGATGWHRVLELEKDCDIYWLGKAGHPEVSVVLYVARVGGNRHKFLEVEVEKENGKTADEDREILRDWERRVLDAFSTAEGPMTLSLFEIFSGKRYPVERALRRTH